jgi:beta-1,4-N-acetylglucosaminyltransferase
MDNHQAELAEEMSKQGYLWHCSNPLHLHELLSKTFSATSSSIPSPNTPLKPWPNTTEAPNIIFDDYLSTKVYPASSAFVSTSGSGSSASSSPLRTLVVLGSGGHTGEMFRLLRSVDRTKFSPLLYCHASNDPMSAQKAVAFENSTSLPSSSTGSSKKNPPSSSSTSSSGLPLGAADFLFSVPRARKVHQSYFTSIFTTLWALFCSVSLVLKTRPQVVITNGPGTCVPVLFLTIIFRKLGLLDKGCQTIYVERYTIFTFLLISFSSF